MAYGINAPFGLRAQSSNIGAAWNGQSNMYPIASGYAVNLFSGDPVTIQNGKLKICGMGEDPLGTFQGCQYYDANGVYVFSPIWTASTPTFQSQDAQAFILADRNIVYSIQCSNSGVAPDNSQLGIAAINLFANATFSIGGTIPLQAGVTYPSGQLVQGNPTSGSPRTGQSAYYLDCASFFYGNPPVAASNMRSQSSWQPLKVIGLDATPGNVYLTTPQVAGTLTSLPVGAFNNALVTLNASLFQANAAVGVIPMSVVTTTISLAQFQASGTTAVTLMQRIVGYLPVVSQVTLTITAGGVTTAGGGTVALNYATAGPAASAQLATAAQINAATVAAAGTKTVFMATGLTLVNPIIGTGGDGYPLALKSSADWTGGTGSTFEVTVTYSFIKI